MTVQTRILRNVKVEPETIKDLDLLAHWQSTSRSEVIQRLLREGARQARMEHVAGLYGRGEVSLERAAELAGVTIYDMMSHVRTHGITPPGNVAELRMDIAGMLLRLGYGDLARQVLQPTPPTE